MELQQVNIDQNRVGPLTLVLRSLRFLLASQIILAAPRLKRQLHFDHSCAACFSIDSVGMLKLFTAALRVSLKRFIYDHLESSFPPVIPHGRFFKSVIRHSYDMACPSQLCQLKTVCMFASLTSSGPLCLKCCLPICFLTILSKVVHVSGLSLSA